MFRVPFRLVNSHILDTSLALDSSNTCGCRHHAGPFDKQTKYEIKAHPRGDSDEIKMEITLSCIACLHSHWTHCQVGPRKKTRKLSTKKGRERETENKTSTFFPKYLMCCVCVYALRNRIPKVCRNNRRYRRHCHLIFRCCCCYASH